MPAGTLLIIDDETRLQELLVLEGYASASSSQCTQQFRAVARRRPWCVGGLGCA